MRKTMNQKFTQASKLAEIKEMINKNPDPIDFCLELSAHQNISGDQDANKLAWKQWMQAHNHPPPSL